MGMTGGGHVAVFAFPFATHAAPLLSLVQRLAMASPDMIFSFFSTHQSNKSIFSDQKREMIKPFDIEDGLPENYVFRGNPQEPVELFIRATPHNYKRSLQVAVDERKREISCVISDAFLWFCQEIAAELGVPWIPVWTAGPFSLSSHVYTDVIRQTFADKRAQDCQKETLDFIPGMSKMCAKDLPEGILFGNLETEFPRLLHGMARTLPKATAVAINSFEEIDETITEDLKTKFNKFLNVGPFTLTSPTNQPASDDNGCLSWLSNHKPASVVYISFGSIITPPPKEVVALAEALEKSGFPFLWSARGNTIDFLPEGFLERTAEKGKIVPWAPQKEVLAHESIGVFVTHCGWNSIFESIVGGVCMICRPFFGDQGLNTKVLEDICEFGLGVKDGVIEKDDMISLLERILLQEEGKKMTEKLLNLKSLAERAVGPNGSSTENFKTLLEIVTATK
ncbi:UDP-glucuronosyl/UDP-glucosyltransferase [Dillenia turbinata]|uniref:UDP-glucuronosyl/UDP-glucosyltransferase n=1 Tax=Dillenia turbinata TaxID=194707 RepID=A0AAN8VXX4_9MAGN